MYELQNGNRKISQNTFFSQLATYVSPFPSPLDEKASSYTWKLKTKSPEYMLVKCVSAKQQLKTECFLCPKFKNVSVAFSISTGLLKRTPGFVAQKLLEMSQRCFKIPLLVCNNATTIPCTCWCKRWLISIKFEHDAGCVCGLHRCYC